MVTHRDDRRIETLEDALRELEAADGRLEEARLDAQLWQQRYLDLYREYDVIRNSQCWKMTYPLRRCLDMVKASSGGSLLHKTAVSLRHQGVRATADKAVRYLQKKRAARPAPPPRPLTCFADLLAELKKTAGVRIRAGRTLEGFDADAREKVLLISHELTLTGAPIALGCLVDEFMREGFMPVVFSAADGAYGGVLKEKGVPVIVCSKVYENDLVRRMAGLFRMAVVNTILGGPVVDALKDVNMPVLWWIHESQTSYIEHAVCGMPEFIPQNTAVYTAGDYACALMKKHRPDYEAENLLYCVPDCADEDGGAYPLPAQAKGKTVFLNIGSLERRKGQYLFADALMMLDEDELKKGYYIFVGKRFDEINETAIRKLQKRYPEHVLYIEQLDRREIMRLYRAGSCLVCSSLDDPMPVVVAEALMFSKTVICSANTGSAALLEKEGSGLVYGNNDPRELADKIRHVLSQPPELARMQKAARRTYEKYFSLSAFEESAGRAIKRLIASHSMLPETETDLSHLLTSEGYAGTVSVVIPTYNAGEQFEGMLARLNAQKGVARIEIVAVDSGSTDETPERCIRHGALLHRIAQAEFTHSHARNLGASLASGEIIIFMTQDAMPGDTDWMYKMILPVARGEAAAVSCREICPEGTDLYYRFGSWFHARYMGVDRGDQLGAMQLHDDVDALRRKGSLNDVACAIHAKVFACFGYRFGYAEDLDMGMRLLRAGYRVKLLGSASVIHGHNRPAGYHLRRSFVEKRTFGKIDARWAVPPQQQETVISRIVCAFEYLEAALASAEELYALPCGGAYLDGLKQRMARTLEKGRHAPIGHEGMIAGDAVLRTVYDICKDIAQREGIACSDRSICVEMNGYLETVIAPYMAAHPEVWQEEGVKQAIALGLVKRLGDMTGLELGALERGCELYSRIEGLMGGV